MVDKTKKQPPIQGALEKARCFKGAIDLERKRRRQEDRRHLTVQWIGGIFAFVGINGSFVIFLCQTGIIELLIDKWDLGYTLSSLIFVTFYFGLAFLLALTFFWLLDKTGMHYLIEDWVVSFHKYKKFPRKKRRGVIRYTKKELDEITDQLCRLELEADENDDEKLSDSIESLNQVLSTLDTETDISSRSLIRQPEYASWQGFVLALKETSNDLELELKEIARYHNKIQPLLKHACSITSKTLSWVLDYCDEKNEGTIIKNRGTQK